MIFYNATSVFGGSEVAALTDKVQKGLQKCVSGAEEVVICQNV